MIAGDEEVQKVKLVTRFAPTPSGYLHLGNLYNLLLVERLAKQLGADLILRVDDLDRSRYRRKYAEDIFRVMRWLGVDWTAGPRSVAELESTYSQNLRLDRYTAALDRLRPHVFACRCSRSDVSEASEDGGYPGTCRDVGIPLDAPDVAWRFRLDGAPDVRDPVVRKRDGRPAYHIASVVDDVDMGITHVVRGEDLRASTRIQQALARALESTPSPTSDLGPDYSAFARVVFLHHPLLTAREDAKISKSAGRRAQSLLETTGFTPEDVRAGFDAWRISTLTASGSHFASRSRRPP
ncbi:MAG: glutamate--tRNA ligase family protein [Rhodothermales bacterium]